MNKRLSYAQKACLRAIPYGEWVDVPRYYTCGTHHGVANSTIKSLIKRGYIKRKKTNPGLGKIMKVIDIDD